MRIRLVAKYNWVLLITIFFSGYKALAQQTDREKLEAYMERFFIHSADTLRVDDSVMFYSGNVRMTIMGNTARSDMAIVVFRGVGFTENNKTANIKELNATIKGNIKIMRKDNLTIHTDSLYIDLTKN